MTILQRFFLLLDDCVLDVMEQMAPTPMVPLDLAIEQHLRPCHLLYY